MRPLALLLAAALSWLLCSEALAYEYEKGDLKLNLSGYLDARAVAPFDRGVPDEDPTTELGLEGKATLSTWAAAKLFLQAIDPGTVTGPDNGRLFNQLTKVYQDKRPCIDVDEAYVDFFADKIEARVGIQKFSWGRLDEVNPTDNINPEDYSQGTINDELERKIGIPAVKVSAFSDLANVELAWIPRYVPYRLPQPDEKWYPNPLKSPDFIESNGTVGLIPTTSRHDDLSMPGGGLEHSESAVRISKYISGWDVSASYYHGYDVMPITDVYPDLTITFVDLLSLDYSLALDLTYKPVVRKMNVYGFDFTTTLGSFTVRGEAAYYDGKRYNRRMDSVLSEQLSREKQQEIFDEFYDNYIDSGGTLTTQTFHFKPQINIPMDTIKYGLGADYIHGDTSVSVQFIQQYIPDYDRDMPVYFVNDNGFNSMLTLLFKQFFLQNTLEATVSGAYGIEFKDYVVKPSLKYSFTNTLQGTVGLVILGGSDEYSMFGQYDDNDEAFVRVRFSF